MMCFMALALGEDTGGLFDESIDATLPLHKGRIFGAVLGYVGLLTGRSKTE